MIFFSPLVISAQKEGSCQKGSSELWAARKAAAPDAGREIVVRVKFSGWILGKRSREGFLIWAGVTKTIMVRIRISIPF